MDKAKVTKIAVSTVAIASVLFGAATASAQEDQRIKAVIDEVNNTTKIAQASQKKVDDTVDATQKLFNEFKGVLKTNEGLRAYNAQQRRVIKAQEEEIRKQETAIGQIDEIKRQITPLMLDMIEDLKVFITNDVPFNMDDRQDRVEKLTEAMDDPNVSDPERFRVVLEAYKAEVQYGRTVNAYEGLLEDGRSVNFIRLGRIGFYYQTKDGIETAAWNNDSRQWEALGPEYATPVKQLMRMARRQVPLDALVLPIAGPKEK